MYIHQSETKDINQYKEESKRKCFKENIMHKKITCERSSNTTKYQDKITQFLKVIVLTLYTIIASTSRPFSNKNLGDSGMWYRPITAAKEGKEHTTRKMRQELK